jgi:hypothetical protein
MQFPEDANGDTLWRMQCAGDDLSKPREIEFFAVFPSEKLAIDFGCHLLRKKQKVQLLPPEDGAEKPAWTIKVCAVMSPIHANITRYENAVVADAKRFRGHGEGWGCLQQ